MSDDLISRQAAIDAINRLVGDTKHCKVGTISFRDGIIDGYCRIRSELLALPSAQSDIVRCKDCKFSDEFEGDVWLCRRRKKSERVSEIGTCNVAERRDNK